MSESTSSPPEKACGEEVCAELSQIDESKELCDEIKSKYAVSLELLTDFIRFSADSSFTEAEAVISTLSRFIERNTDSSCHGLFSALANASKAICELERRKNRRCTIAVKSSSKLVSRFVTRLSAEELNDIALVKRQALIRSKQFLEMVRTATSRIAELAVPFIRDGSVVFVHGYSRVVAAILMARAHESTRFTIITTEGRPECSGDRLVGELKKGGVAVEMVSDLSMAYSLEAKGVDLVLVGAEGLCENGGIVNKIGTFQLAIVASRLKIPFYVGVQSFKFENIFPLAQRDVEVPAEEKLSGKMDGQPVDYTPPDLITLMFTDLGTLTPSAATEALMRLHL